MRNDEKHDDKFGPSSAAVAEKDRRIDRRLDEALEETFPASDPVSISQPAVSVRLMPLRDSCLIDRQSQRACLHESSSPYRATSPPI